MARYRIVSIDGGGIRGIVTTVIMQRLASTPGLENFLDGVDLIAGTSTGGLLALAMARGKSLEEIHEFYVTDGPKIFDDSWLDNLLDLGKLRGADYKTAPMKRVFKRILGSDTTLGQLGKNVLITTFDLDNEDTDRSQRTWKPKIFHNLAGTDSDDSELAYKVGLYTAAAPTYFPSVDGYVDGGVYANNPSMCALAQARDKRYFEPPTDLEDIVLLSLGTGTSPFHIKGKTHDWGYAQWIKPLINLMLDGVSGIADYQCQQMLGDQYHRLAPVFPPKKAFPLDAIDKIPELIDFATDPGKVKIDETVAWIKEHWL